MGVVPPAEGFLEALREACDRTGALLVFDEVITGFRFARGGAQELFGVTPDLTVLGKIVGGGLPLAAFGGRADVMSELAPVRPRLPGRDALGEPARDCSRARHPQAPAQIRRSTSNSSSRARPGARSPPGRREARPRYSESAPCSRSSSPRDQCGTSRTPRLATPGATAPTSATCSTRGVYVAPSQFEAMFLSTAHGSTEIEETVAAAAGFFRGG